MTRSLKLVNTSTGDPTDVVLVEQGSANELLVADGNGGYDFQPVATAIPAASNSLSGRVELATPAEAKAASDATRALTPADLLQSAPVLGAGSLAALFAQHYQIAPLAVAAAVIHAAITLPSTGTTAVTTAIVNPDVPRTLTITGNAVGISGNVVIAGTNIAGAAISDTIALSGTDTVEGVKAFRTVTSITVPARNAEGDTATVGVGKKFGLAHIVAFAAFLLVKLFGGSADVGTLAVDADEIEKNLFALNGTPDGSTAVDLVYLV